MQATHNTTNNITSNIPTTELYYIRCSRYYGVGTIVAVSSDYDKALIRLAARITEDSTSMEVDPVPCLSYVRDIVKDLLSYEYCPDDLNRIMSDYDTEDDDDIARLYDYLIDQLDYTDSEWFEGLCEQAQASTDVVLEYDTIEELYRFWMDSELPA